MIARAVALLQLPAHAVHARLLAKLHAELERRGRGARTLALKTLTPDEHLALANLTGAPSVAATPVRVQVRVLDEALKKSALACGLFELLDALHSGVRDRPAERSAQRQAEAAVWAQAQDQLSAHPSAHALLPWLHDLRQSGLLKRVGLPTSAVLTQIIPVVQTLPAKALPLSVLAARTVGDAHALDRGQPLSSIALGAAAALTGTAAVPTAAGPRRRLWAKVGVICDLLSCDVLVHNLRPQPIGRLARHLNECAEAGEPTRITLRELMQHALTWNVADVFICENPCVTALAADQLGPRSHPLICTDGQPTTAVMHLLDSLRSAGSRLHFHGDFDWGGLRIGNHLVRALEVQPWMFDSASYLRHVAHHAPRVRLKSRPTVAAWDGQLHQVMSERGSAVFEEQVAVELVRELAKE